MHELKESTKLDAEEVLKDRMLEIKWKADYKIHLKQEGDFKHNLGESTCPYMGQLLLLRSAVGS